jgi:hypothetical protein
MRKTRRDERGTPLLYLAPSVRCSKCWRSIPLPYGRLPRETLTNVLMPSYSGSDQLEWPEDGWSRVFGCYKCGCIAIYGDYDVFVKYVLRDTEGGCHDDSNCFSARFPCANILCKAPTTVYVDIPTGSESDVLKFFRSPRSQGKLPCGHYLESVPEREYNISKVTERLWGTY